MLREHNNCLDDNNLIKYCNESLLAVILECLSICFFKLNTGHSLTDCKEIIMTFNILFLNI
jgi:hypothetical protein